MLYGCSQNAAAFNKSNTDYVYMFLYKLAAAGCLIWGLQQVNVFLSITTTDNIKAFIFNVILKMYV